MKLPLRSDEGPEAWISYDSLEVGFRSDQAMQDYLKRELPHTHFFIEGHQPVTVISRTREISRGPVPKERALSVIPERSQAISLIPIIIDVVANKRSPRRRKIMAPKGTEQQEKPKSDEGIFTKKMWKTTSVLLILLVLFLGWKVSNCNNCKKETVQTIDQKPRGNEQAGAAVKQQPTRVPTEAPAAVKLLGHQKLVLVNKTGKSVRIGLIFNGQPMSRDLAAGQTSPDINTHELSLVVEINGSRQNIPLKKGQVTKFAIQSAS